MIARKAQWSKSRRTLEGEVKQKIRRPTIKVRQGKVAVLTPMLGLGEKKDGSY